MLSASWQIPKSYASDFGIWFIFWEVNVYSGLQQLKYIVLKSSDAFVDISFITDE